ncbi:MAG: translation initiation factor IF-2 [Candidatus Harrisonbacteria bacterium]|nr:translation initiation factor IF-2 [Candidatus Harrisonbacteria bacterium]
MSSEDEKKLKRPPVVVVVGHVDHGKTSLLDYIRKTNVAAKEAGGITQSIGAYEIEHPSTSSGQGRKITFIDTPGHEAFSKMRVRGAHAADVGILVVAGDEGVKPQTKEALKALQDSKTPFVVAITKIDKPNADLERVKNDLTANNVLLEGYGGNISYQGVSSKTGDGINELLDLILLTADLEELEYNADATASGIILEAKLDNRRGNTVTVILTGGRLRRGDLIATATVKGKVKNLENFLGKSVDELSPSSPAVVLGFESLPEVGEEFVAGKLFEEDLAKVKKTIVRRLETSDTTNKESQTVRIILKADVAGSLEALHDLLRGVPIKENQTLDIIGQSVGEITDGDVKDAVATGAMILGFRVQLNKAAENLARAQEVTVLTNDIIYKLVEEIEKLFLEMGKSKYSGELEILAVFSAKGNRQTIGGRVNRGQIRIKSWLDIQRADEIIGKGKVINLQQQKRDVNAVDAGNECGLIFESEVKMVVGDKLLSK